MNLSTEKKIMVSIIAFGVLLRLVLCLMHPFNFPDSADYDALAKAIVQGEPYQVNGLYATRMPGYPVFVAAIYMIAGPRLPAVLVIQCLLSGGVICLSHAVARRISPTVGLIAAFLAALDPLSIGFTAAMLSETPFTLAFLLGLWILLRIAEARRIGWWPLFGLTWGIAVYLRASAYYLWLPLALWPTLFGRARHPAKKAFPGIAISLVVLLLALLPWQLRNYERFHSHFSRLTTLEGISLYEAVYPEADGSPKQDKITLPADMQRLDEAERNDEWNRRAWEYIRTDPLRIFELAFRKIGRTWSPTLNAVEFRNPVIQLALACWYIPLFLLAAAGLFSRRVPAHLNILLLIPILYFTAVHALYLGSVRYRVPLMPLVCILAAAGVMEILERLRRTKRGGNLMV